MIIIPMGCFLYFDFWRIPFRRGRIRNNNITTGPSNPQQRCVCWTAEKVQQKTRRGEPAPQRGRSGSTRRIAAGRQSLAQIEKPAVRGRASRDRGRLGMKLTLGEMRSLAPLGHFDASFRPELNAGLSPSNRLSRYDACSDYISIGLSGDK